MKNCVFLIFLAGFHSFPQTLYKTVQSVNLLETREFKVQLPRGFEEHPDKTYPLVLVLDGDYLFEPVAGNVDYCSYWDQIPASVVVGVNQAGFRSADISFDEIRDLPLESSKAFYDFLKKELIPHILETYRINDFRILVAQGAAANFANYFLVHDPQLFDVFINLSPIFTENMEQQIMASLNTVEENKWYYIATASEDYNAVQTQLSGFDVELSAINRPNVFYCFDNIPDQTHYSLVPHAIPNALETVFSIYAPIGPEEFRTKVLVAPSPYEYLEAKYDSIENTYGWKPDIKSSDMLAICNAIEKNKKWDDFKELSKMAKHNFPESVMEDYFMARYYEENGNPKKAFHHFQNAYPKKEIGYLTRDYLWKYITQLKTDFGY